MPLECEAYSDFLKIEELAPEWDKLLAVSACNQAFSSLEWYLASCRLDKISKPFLIVARSGSNVRGILPLVCSPDGIGCFPHFGTDYNDLVAPGNDSALPYALLNHAVYASNACRRVVLSRLRPDSICLQAVPSIAADSASSCRVRQINQFACIQLPHTFDEYLASRSKVFRKSIKRAVQKIATDGVVFDELLPHEFDPAGLPELFISLSLARHKERSFLQDNNARSFVREVIPSVFKKRRLRAFVLRKGSHIVALDLCTVRSAGLATWNGGFLAEAECWSPGTVLFASGIKAAIDLGLKEYDFTEGREPYKLHWTNHSYAVSELSVSK
jgi:CelD/BcsL family acetyltransferase involved in cellulose biosynthesis